jgi:hypothetical protein
MYIMQHFEEHANIFSLFLFFITVNTNLLGNNLNYL